jgi:hypothetical protein
VFSANDETSSDTGGGVKKNARLFASCLQFNPGPEGENLHPGRNWGGKASANVIQVALKF